MTKNIFAILFLSFIVLKAQTQEVLTMPAFNPAVANQYRVTKSVAKTTPSLTLPFYEDFSAISVYPSPLRWADNFAFVNTDFAKYPPTIGVATLDALDEKGALYPNAGQFPFDADYLTSLPIRLDSIFTTEMRAITRADSIYFSFYYQPQGRSISPPAKNASLILEFHSPGDTSFTVSGNDTIVTQNWNQIWSTQGGVQVDTFAMPIVPNNRYFRQVIIPMTGIIDSALYYKNGFQFRFRNIASLAGNSQPDWRSNGSIWNIDIVYLSTGGLIQNTKLQDVAFGDLAPSMLRNYESMPYRQYSDNFINEMTDTLRISIANLDNVVANVTYKYNVRKNSGSPFTTYNPGGFNIDPFELDGYSKYPAFARPPVNFFYPISNEEKVVFHVIHSLSADPNPLFRSNDTIQFDQMFSNYYAYDNGSAEAGVGINGAAGSYAVQFKLNIPDTLRGFQIYFNPVIGGVNQKQIDLNVWNDEYGEPGQVIKTLPGVTPIYTGSQNEFSSYWFEEPLVIDAATFPGLTFYIGWSQTFIENLNVGFDRYKDSHTKRFYNVDGTWQGSDSINYGSVLMHPIVGLVNPLGIEKPSEVQHISIQPNPVTDGNLIIQLPGTWKKTTGNDLEINIVSATGSYVYSDIFSNPVNVSGLTPGFYMVILTDNANGQRATGKLIIR